MLPLAIAVYFILWHLNPIIANEKWFEPCETARSDAIVSRLEWNRIYYYVLGAVTLLRMPQWFLYKIHFFRKMALVMWFSHILLLFIHLTTILLINSKLDTDTCEGWKDLRKWEYIGLGVTPVIAFFGMIRIKRVQEYF